MNMWATKTQAVGEHCAAQAENMFSTVRTWIPLVSVLLASCAICGAHGDQREKRATANVEQLGGFIGRDGMGKVIVVHFIEIRKDKPLTDEKIESVDFAAFPPGVGLTLNALNLSDRSLLHLAKMPELYSCDIKRTKITDKGLVQFVKKQPALCSLSVLAAPITDEPLKEISSLEELRYLELIDVPISDKGVTKLGKLKDLVSLDLTGTEITDDALPAIAMLARLRFLKLNRTRITDLGLQRLSSLRELQWLYVTSTKVTEKGKRDLQVQLPSLQFKN